MENPTHRLAGLERIGEAIGQLTEVELPDLLGSPVWKRPFSRDEAKALVVRMLHAEAELRWALDSLRNHLQFA